MTGKTGAYNVALAKMIYDKKEFYSPYLFYYLSTPFFQTPIHMISRSAQNGFNKGDLSDILLPVAPFADQHKIVAEIEKQFTRLEAGVVALRRVQANLKRYRAAVLKAACEGNLLSSRCSRLWNRLELTDGPVAKLPAAWKWTTPIEVCEKVVDCHNKTAPYSTSGIPLIRTTNIRTGKIDLS